MAVPGQIKLNELVSLPFTTLSFMAIQLALDIKAGEEEKRPTLEAIFEAMEKQL